MVRLRKILRAAVPDVRAFTMVGALFVIWLFFHWTTSPNCPEIRQLATTEGWQAHLHFFFSFDWLTTGIFLSSRNLSNLILQTSVTGIIAVGMLLVIVSGNIDLSVGSVAGLAGGVAAIVMSSTGAGVFTACAAAVAVAVAIGILHGWLTAFGNIPAFIVTLGGLLAWRGAIKGITQSETIPIAGESFKFIGQGYLPNVELPLGQSALVELNLGWALAVIAVAVLLFNYFRSIRRGGPYGAASKPADTLGVVTSVVAVIAFVLVMNAYKGVPIPVLILLIVALVGAFISKHTVFGRYLYAIGGNADAARLSGINIRSTILKAFVFIGLLTGIAALISTARVGSAAPDAGTLRELDAIAACVIGGASLMGGRGTVFGACLGALIMTSLDNGMSLLNVRDFMQEIIKGAILVAAVGADMYGRRPL
jgi:D-xylose transport system permease protein